MKYNYSITFLAITAQIIWATAVLTAKFGFTYLGPCSLAGIRLLISGVIIILITGSIRSSILTIAKHIKEIALISLFQSFLTFYLIYTGMMYVSGAITTIVLGFEPAICTLLAHIILKNDRLSKNKLLSIILSLGGIAAISLTTRPWTEFGFKPFVGIILITLGIAASGIGNILILANKSEIDYRVLNGGQLLVSAVPFIIIGLFFEVNNFAVTEYPFLISVIWVTMISVISSNIWAYLLKVKKAKVSYINMWGFLNPVAGTVLCIIFLPGETFSYVTVAGICVVIVSLILLYKSDHNKVYMVNE